MSIEGQIAVLVQVIEAREVIEQALGELIEMGDSFGEAAGYSYMGLILENERDFQGGIEYYSKGMEMFKDLSIQGNVIDAQAGHRNEKREIPVLLIKADQVDDKSLGAFVEVCDHESRTRLTGWNE